MGAGRDPGDAPAGGDRPAGGEPAQGSGEWLPPAAPGSDPGPAAPAPGQPPAQGQQAAYGQAPPGYGQAPPGYGQAPPGYGQAPPGYGQAPPGYGPPPGYGQAPYGYGPAYPPTWFPQRTGEPDNTTAITGFCLSIAGVALLVMSAGLSTVLSLGLSVAGAIVGRMGVKKVDAGETSRHRGLGQAGYVVGIVGTVLSVAATVIWILVFVAAFEEGLDNDDIFEDGDTLDVVRPLLPALAAGARALLGA